ncbi:MAG: pyridoxamine 5'-phosphate oxidase family protein [Thermomicrobiales bacterium]
MSDDFRAPQNHDEWLIRDEAALREIFGQADGGAARKSIPFLDRHCRTFIGLAPFLCLGTFGASGRADVSPRGDQPGFVQVLDDCMLAIPDRPGNNRLDSLTNILGNPQVGMIFLIPGFEDTLRVNGKAILTRDPALLRGMAVNNREPKIAIKVAVEEAFLHCAKAFKRSRLWDPTAQVDRKTMPSLVRMIMEQIAEAETKQKPVLVDAEVTAYECEVEEDYRTNLY